MKIFKTILFILFLFGMPVTAFLLGQFWLGMTFSVFYVCFGIIELVSKIRTKMTVSQSVHKMSKKELWILTVAMVVGWGSLIFHFWCML